MRKRAIAIPVPAMSTAWVDCQQLGFGLTLYTLFVKNCIGPLGFVWGIGFGPGNTGKSRFEGMGSYVIPWARRHGVRSKIQAQILDHFDVVTTHSGSKAGGLAFMKSAGYQIDRRSGVWSVARKTKRSAA
jgi:hypothetical protein